MSEKTALLIGTSKNTSIFYVLKIPIVDNIFLALLKGETYVAARGYEVDRIKKTAGLNSVFTLQELYEEEDVNIRMLKFLEKIDAPVDLLIPKNFPYDCGKFLESNGYNLEVKPEPFFESRTIKTKEEIGFIKDAQEAAERALKIALTLIEESVIFKGFLLDGRYHTPLTAEKVRQAIETALFQLGFFTDISCRPIVACGNDTFEPHNSGKGQLRANSPIIIDISPFSKENGYWGDITRTVVKGVASPALENQYQAVLEAQLLALERIREGARCPDIFCAVMEFFKKQNYSSGTINGEKQGFIHSLGHSLGLDIHEFPVLNKFNDHALRRDNVITVEPGLYYEGIGGVRIEDLIVVTKEGFQNLTTFPKEELLLL